MKEGSILYAEEYLGEVLHKLTFRITRVVPNRLIEYKSTFPVSLFATGNAFIIEPRGEEGCTFTATGGIRMPRRLFLMMDKRHEEKLEATARHMKEEGENLKRLVEAG